MKTIYRAVVVSDPNSYTYTFKSAQHYLNSLHIQLTLISTNELITEKQ